MSYLPKVTREDELRLLDECGTTEAQRKKVLIRTLRGFRQTQPALWDVMERYETLYKKEEWFVFLLVYTMQMYRKIEFAFERVGMTVPIVKAEVGAPLQEDLFRSLRSGSDDWFRKKTVEVADRNPTAISDLGWDVALGEGPKGGVWEINAACVSIYLMIESQFQADELAA